MSMTELPSLALGPGWGARAGVHGLNEYGGRRSIGGSEHRTVTPCTHCDLPAIDDLQKILDTTREEDPRYPKPLDRKDYLGHGSASRKSRQKRRGGVGPLLFSFAVDEGRKGRP